MAKVYQSPTVERVGGDTISKTESLVTLVYAAAVAAVAVVAVGINVAAIYNTTWFWGPKYQLPEAS